MARRPVLENAVMDVLWGHGDWLTATQIRQRLERKVAPTTAGTVLGRLHGKGRVERRKQGSTYQYRASQGREEYLASIMEEALDRAQDRPLALMAFVDRLPSRDRKRLRRIL